MAFSWSSLGTIINHEEFDDIRSKVNQLASDSNGLSISWSETPTTFQGNIITKLNFQETQDNIDFIDDNKYCNDYHTTVYSTYDSTKYNTVYNNRHATYDYDQNTGIDYDQHATYDYDQHTQIDYDQHSTYYSTYDRTY